MSTGDTKNNNQSVSLIRKWDLGLTNVSSPDPGIENAIPGLQLLVLSSADMTQCLV